MSYVGMDIHKKTMTFCVVDEAGHVIRRGTVSSGEIGWLEIMAIGLAGKQRLPLKPAP